MEPNKVNIQKWVDALRSGKYAQATDRLKKVDPDTGEAFYCCLGVAAEVHGLKSRLESETIGEYTGWVFVDDKDITYIGAMPDDTGNWLGLSRVNRRVRYNGVDASLVELNDLYHWSFDSIADAIENQWLS